MTGVAYDGHYDLAARDRLVMLAAMAGVEPSCGIPDILPTLFDTDEQHGIIALPDSVIQLAGLSRLRRTHPAPDSTTDFADATVVTPPFLLRHLQHISIKLKSNYSVFQDRFNVQHPPLPFHTAAEFRAFGDILHQPLVSVRNFAHRTEGGKVKFNFVRMASWWNTTQVTEDTRLSTDARIYAKLPSHLESQWKAAMTARETRAIMKTLLTNLDPLVGMLADQAICPPAYQSHDVIDLQATDKARQAAKRAQSASAAIDGPTKRQRLDVHPILATFDSQVAIDARSAGSAPEETSDSSTLSLLRKPVKATDWLLQLLLHTRQLHQAVKRRPCRQHPPHSTFKSRLSLSAVQLRQPVRNVQPRRPHRFERLISYQHSQQPHATHGSPIVETRRLSTPHRGRAAVKHARGGVASTPTSAKVKVVTSTALVCTPTGAARRQNGRSLHDTNRYPTSLVCLSSRADGHSG